MAIYTTFFLCEPEELPGGFPGWRLPLAKPVRREFRNPLTGQVSVYESREPEWPDEADEQRPPRYRAVEIAGRYQDYLEGRLPDFVRDHPHWAAKGLTEVELNPLLEAAGVAGSLESAIDSRPATNAFVQQFPAEFPIKLRSLDPQSVAKRNGPRRCPPRNTRIPRRGISCPTAGP